MDRADLIRAASREAASILVFTDPDTKGQIRTTSDLIAERILDAIEPLIRAEARAEALEFCCQDRAAELRAQMLALPDEHHYGPAGKNRCVKRADVLDLIDGSES